MQEQEKKSRFIALRAEGETFSAISQKLQIDTGVCGAWDRELDEVIREERSRRRAALNEEYGMTQEVTIRRLGEVLQKIDEAVADLDLSALPPEVLLDMQLRYTAALRAEYVSPSMAAGLPYELRSICGED